MCILLYAMSYPPRAAKPWKPHQSGIGENFSLCGHGTTGMQAVNCKIDSSYAWIEGQCVLMSLFPIDVLGPLAADLIFWVVSIELFLAMHKVRVSVCYCAFCTLATDLIFKLVFFQLLPSVHGVRVGVCCCTKFGTLAADLILRLVSIWLQLLFRSFSFFLKTFHRNRKSILFWRQSRHIYCHILFWRQGKNIYCQFCFEDRPTDRQAKV